MEFRKMVTMTLYVRHGYKEQILDSLGEAEGGMI